MTPSYLGKELVQCRFFFTSRLVPGISYRIQCIICWNEAVHNLVSCNTKWMVELYHYMTFYCIWCHSDICTLVTFLPKGIYFSKFDVSFHMSGLLSKLSFFCGLWIYWETMLFITHLLESLLSWWLQITARENDLLLHLTNRLLFW